jgi:hypothetical protein
MTSTALITFDLQGFQPLAPGQWFDPDTRNHIVLIEGQALPAAPLWLDDLPTLRRELARRHAATGMLLEADAVRIGGVPALYTLVKERLSESTAMLFRASFVLAKRTRTVVLKGQFQEFGVSGLRESFARLRGVGAPVPHPYAPELSFRRSDEPAWDFLVPSHPLTKAREWTRAVIRTAAVDRRFAELPDYR